jgi:molybdenum cofactor cytidylyltransferase
MGTNKLFLPWGTTTVLGRLLTTLSAAELHGIFVVGRADDAPLRDAVARFNVESLRLEASRVEFLGASPAPPDMRASIEHGLARIVDEGPVPRDAWLVVPADHPLEAASTITALIDAWTRNPSGIVVPTIGGRRGHPTLFGWPLAEGCRTLPPETGLNLLVRSHADAIAEVPVNDPSIRCDLDTPADYALHRPPG